MRALVVGNGKGYVRVVHEGGMVRVGWCMRMGW